MVGGKQSDVYCTTGKNKEQHKRWDVRVVFVVCGFVVVVQSHDITAHDIKATAIAEHDIVGGSEVLGACDSREKGGGVDRHGACVH